MTLSRPTVGIVGVGTLGAMTAWRLARAGFDVTGFDRLWAGHDEGAAGGGTRMLRRVYAEGSTYGPLLERSIALWQELERESGRDLFFRTGGLSIGSPDHPVIAGGLRDARERDLPHQIFDDSRSLRSRFAPHSLQDGEIALFDPDAGTLRSNHGIVAAIEAAGALGASFRFGVSVDDVDSTSARPAIIADGERFEFDHVVIAAGPWAQELLPDVPLQTRSIFHTWHLVQQRHLLRVDGFPIVLRRTDAQSSFGLMSSLDGTRVKLSPHFDYDRDVDAVADLDRRVSAELQRRSIDLVTRLLPGVVPGPVEARHFPESFTPDGHAAVGALDADSRVIVLAGFSGHGFKLSPGFADAVADLLSTGTGTTLPVEVALDRDYRAQVSIRDLVLDSSPTPHA